YIPIYLYTYTPIHLYTYILIHLYTYILIYLFPHPPRPLETLKLLKIDAESRMPKYRQIVNSIMEEIEKGNLKVGNRIPSINEISEEYYLSRDTVEKAYNYLKEKKIIVAAKGKGYYVARTVETSSQSIL